MKNINSKKALIAVSIMILLIIAIVVTVMVTKSKEYINTYVILMENTDFSKEEVREKLESIKGIKKITYMSEEPIGIYEKWEEMGIIKER